MCLFSAKKYYTKTSLKRRETTKNKKQLLKAMQTNTTHRQIGHISRTFHGVHGRNGVVCASLLELK